MTVTLAQMAVNSFSPLPALYIVPKYHPVNGFAFCTFTFIYMYFNLFFTIIFKYKKKKHTLPNENPSLTQGKQKPGIKLGENREKKRSKVKINGSLINIPNGQTH